MAYGTIISDAAVREFYAYKAIALDAAKDLYYNQPDVIKAIKKAKNIFEIQCIQRNARENL